MRVTATPAPVTQRLRSRALTEDREGEADEDFEASVARSMAYAGVSDATRAATSVTTTTQCALWPTSLTTQPIS